MEYEGIAVPGTLGWAEVVLSDEDKPPRVLVKFGSNRTGRDIITCIIVVGAELDPSTEHVIPIDSSTLRAIPIGRVEALLNSTILQAARGWREPGPFVKETSEIERALATYLRNVQPRRPLPKARAAKTRRKPLARPDGTDPDAFYRLVADAYNDLILTTSAPAPILAEEAGVPVPTVHRWIAEARRRGVLPPARRGRAG